MQQLWIDKLSPASMSSSVNLFSVSVWISVKFMNTNFDRWGWEHIIKFGYISCIWTLAKNKSKWALCSLCCCVFKHFLRFPTHTKWMRFFLLSKNIVIAKSIAGVYWILILAESIVTIWWTSQTISSSWLWNNTSSVSMLEAFPCVV